MRKYRKPMPWEIEQVITGIDSAGEETKEIKELKNALLMGEHQARADENTYLEDTICLQKNQAK